MWYCPPKARFSETKAQRYNCGSYADGIQNVCAANSRIWKYNLEPVSAVSKYQINKLERVQRIAARFIYAEYRRNQSVTALLAKAELPLLASRRKMARLFSFLSFTNCSTAN